MAFLSWRTVRWLPIGLLLPWAAADLGGAEGKSEAKGEKLWVFVGTYTQGASKGIYRLELDLATGKLSEPKLAAEVANPSFLAIHPSRRFLYAVSEGGKQGAVSALSLDPKTGELAVLNHQSSHGTSPCHVVVDKQGKNVLVANYSSGTAAVLPVGADGRLSEASSVKKLTGTGPDKGRQEAPHAHSINLDPANRFAFVADLGTDHVWIFGFDGGQGKLEAHQPDSASVAPAAGPRHFAFHPNGKYAYVINEMANTITAFNYDADKGALTQLQTVTTLPKDFKGKSYTAEVVVHPSGKFVYGSNRGHDSIAVFQVDAGSGKLTPAGYQGQQVKTPRNFAVDPTGAYLIVANQGGNSLVVFRVNPESGELTPTGNSAQVPIPVCVRMMRQAR